MRLVRIIGYRWLPLAALATVLCLLVYLTAQQIWRQSANDPQILMAREAATGLEAGQPVDAVVPKTPIDIGRSLAPFVMLFNDEGQVLASSGKLHDQVRVIPLGVLDHARQSGEERVTWQPERGVRIATVIVRHSGTPSGFVLVGRSLRETEQRIGQLGQLVSLAWVAVVAGLLVLAAMTEFGLYERRGDLTPPAKSTSF